MHAYLATLFVADPSVLPNLPDHDTIAYNYVTVLSLNLHYMYGLDIDEANALAWEGLRETAFWDLRPESIKNNITAINQDHRLGIRGHKCKRSMKNKLLFLNLLVLAAFSGYTQEKNTDKLRSEIFKIVIPKDDNYLEKGKFKSSVIAFSYAIGTDEKGKIDTISLSNSVLNEHSGFVNYERIKAELKKQEDLFKNFRNTLFFGMLMVANGELDYIRPNQLYSSWPKLLQNLQPLLGRKKLVVYDPFLTLFYYKKSD